MGVPGHDERDFNFAKKYGLPIKIVIQNQDKTLCLDEMETAYVDDGIMVDSGSFTGLFGEDGRKEVTKYLEANQAGRKRVTSVSYTHLYHIMRANQEHYWRIGEGYRP